ncbi:hypothetical protein GMDG_00645 [Pseudogymnoascus destructans 20631-21]|uniref:Uncharacterized protein n=1 Tax=Pseudogymnoascus destructans (strain ATCC MYA-4855 / 20631-21) TaxID=658429 RepID=L8G7E5_PSED2|nr:hypothetical protein GMDG_00645 [Pseudogymnoascus destructans 20631-21]
MPPRKGGKTTAPKKTRPRKPTAKAKEKGKAVLPSVEDNDELVPRRPAPEATPRQTHSATVASEDGAPSQAGAARRLIAFPAMGTPQRFNRPANPSILGGEFSPSRAPCTKPVIPMCLRCSKNVFKFKTELKCTRANSMARCQYCSDQHCHCLPIPKFAIKRFNRMMVAHAQFMASWNVDEMVIPVIKARSQILKARQAKYTQFVERGKNLLGRRRAFGADSKPEKINVGLALLAVADNIKALQRVARFKADMYQAKHQHNPAVATCEEYESSDSEVESEAFPGEDDNDLELEAKLACQPEPSPARSHISNDDFSDVEDGDVAA